MGADWKAYYEKEVAISDFSPETDPSEMQRCLAAWSIFPRERVSSVLDVGCGDGFFCSWLLKRAHPKRIEGVDVSEARLLRARSRYPDVRFAKGELPVLPYNDNEFEVVTCIEVLEHQEEPVAALRELVRVSSRYVVFTVPDREKVQTILCPHCLNTFPASGHLHSFDNRQIAKMADEAGVKLIRIRSYYPPMGATSGALPFWIGRLLRSLELLIAPRPGSYLASLLLKK